MPYFCHSVFMFPVTRDVPTTLPTLHECPMERVYHPSSSTPSRFTSSSSRWVAPPTLRSDNHVLLGSIATTPLTNKSTPLDEKWKYENEPFRLLFFSNCPHRPSELWISSRGLGLPTSKTRTADEKMRRIGNTKEKKTDFAIFLKNKSGREYDL